MDANIELVVNGSYEVALEAGQAAADVLAKGAKDVTITARKLKKTGQWKVIIKYQRVVDKSKPFDLNAFFNITNK